MRTTKTTLAIGVAGMALATGLSAPAQAACTVSGSTVTCTADSTAAEVNAALASVVGADVTLNIASNANVVQPGTAISPTQQGEVVVTNAGDVGEDAARVNLTYVGTADAATNTFDLANSGSISGNVGIFNVGGPISVDNSGLIGNGLTISTPGSGAIVINSSGIIDADGATGVFVNTRGDVDVVIEGDVGTVATEMMPSALKNVSVSSFQGVTTGATTTVTTVGTATTTTTTNAAGSFSVEGGTTSVALAEGGNSGTILVGGLDSASVVVDGTVGSSTEVRNVDASSNAIAVDRTTVSVVDGANSSFSTTSVRTALGGTASVTVGETGNVSGTVTASGLASASVAIDGTVGRANAPAGATALSNGFDLTTVSTSATQGAVGSSTFNQTMTAAGGDADISVSETGVLNGFASAFANGDASVANLGYISGNVFATAGGTDSVFEQASSNDGAGNSNFSQLSESTTTGGTASIDNAAGALIGASATSPVFVSASGDTAASVTNAGRINGNVAVESSGQFSSSEFEQADTQSTAAATGVITTTTSTNSDSTSVNLGGDASFANAEGGLVTGSVDVRGQGSATVTNNGAVIGTTYAQSTFDDQVSTSESITTSVFVPGADGGTTDTQNVITTSAQASTGGDVTGTYAGSNGAVQFAPFGGASDGSVTQVANGNSTAIVSGLIVGNFTGNASGSEFASTSTFESTNVFDADGDQRSLDDSFSSESTTRQSDSNSTLAVDGGTITGSASLFATGAASAQLGNGAEIGGSLSVTAQGFAGDDQSQTNVRSFGFDEDGVFTGREEVSTASYQSLVNSGDVSVSIGEATVGGNVNLSGTAGNNTFTLAEDGAVGGAVFQFSNVSDFASEDTLTTTATPTITTQTRDYAQSSTALGGDVSATVAGTIGLAGGDLLEYGDVTSAGGTSLSLFTNAGNASATVSGQVRNGISVFTSGSDTTLDFQQTTRNGLTTAYSDQRSSTATGGTATLVIAADDIDVPANFGNIFVAGRDGSSVTIGVNSSVLAARNTVSLVVGSNYADTTSTRDDTYTGTVLTGQVLTSTSTIVGGASSLANNGRIGFDGGTGFGGQNAVVQVISPTSASATNNGAIYGSVNVRSLHQNLATTTTRTNLNDVTRVDTIDRVYEADGGTATLTNNGLVTGSASVAALDGVVTNNGVVRGSLFLGASVNNYTTRSVNTLTQIGVEEVLDLAEAIEQNYAVAQNGFLGGTISVSGAFGLLDDTVQTSNITADIALNSGSVTGGGVVAEYDDRTGERFTNTTVNLNGSGYLGIGDVALAALDDAFGDVDPQIALTGDLSAYAGGARVLGVESLNKTGSGVFLITGANFAPVSNTNRFADYTLDIGTFTISGGEIQLDTTTSDGVFGIRGNVVNNAGLVLGSRVALPAPLFGTNASVTAIDGVEVYQQGNFTQSSTGTLTVGITPTLVRVVDPAFSSVSFSSNPLAVQQIGLASGLFTTPDRAFGQAFTDLGTGFLTLDGNLNLGGTVQLLSPTGGLFTNGQRVDIASVSGTVNASANVVVNGRSNFVTFDLATRSQGGRTIVFVSADRAGFETVATNQNATAAGTALSAALPGVVATIRAGSAGGIGINGSQFVLAQDLANIFVAFDNLVTTAQVAEALNELASGEFYGSLIGMSTTAPFVDAITTPRLPEGATGFNVWFAPSGDFAKYDGDSTIGSFDVDADNYGGSLGFGVATGNGELGVGFGYGRIDATSRGRLLHAQADTWMIGAYARQAFGPLAVGAELVYGWSTWDATRTMPLMSREARAEFDSTELRGTLHAEYTVDFGGGWIAPYGQLAFRKYDFDGFTEEGAASVNLIVEQAKDTVFSPTLGLRAGTTFDTGMATLRPEIDVSYTFQGDTNSFRDVAYQGAPGTSFRLQGIEPDNYFTIGAGLFAEIGRHSGAFLRGSYTTGDNVKVTSVSAGVTIGF